MSNKKYTVDASRLASTLSGLFGTRKHAYDSLRLGLVGLTMPAFYRIWREGRASLPEFQTLTAMLGWWWRHRPDTASEAAVYIPSYTTDLIDQWTRNLSTRTTGGRP